MNVHLGEIGQLMIGVAAVGGWLQSLRNGRTLEEVHRTTNSVAKRNEAIAKELGIAEGMASQAIKDKDGAP